MKNQYSYPNSVMFWNVIAILAIIGTYFINLQIFWVTQGITSMLALCQFLNKEKGENHLWIIATSIFWFLIILIGFVYICEQIYKYTFEKFNNWINKL